MNRTIEMLPEAVADLEAVAARAGQDSPAARLNFLLAIAKKVQLIEQMPEMHAALPQRPHIRKCVVTATVNLYYHIQPTTIEIIGIADSRCGLGSLNLPT